jgi:tRNA threonylcarbamoyladenosine modification (KEOPS) complex Cgi121 subunit
LLKRITQEKPEDVEIQLFNSELVATWQHLYFAALNALMAFQNKENISKNLAMETILYASAQHQIRKATEVLGITSSSSKIAVLVIGRRPRTVRTVLSKISEQLDAERDDAVLELTDKKMRNIQSAFAISNAELEAMMKKDERKKTLVDLVIEKMALLATMR